MSMLKLVKDSLDEFEKSLEVPQHIHEIASMVRSDLLYGPTYVRENLPIEDFNEDSYVDYTSIPNDWPESEVKTGYTSSYAEALREFIDDLPSVLYVNIQCGSYSTDEPNYFYEDEETGETFDESNDWLLVEHEDIVKHIFGSTIATEFR